MAPKMAGARRRGLRRDPLTGPGKGRRRVRTGPPASPARLCGAEAIRSPPPRSGRQRHTAMRLPGGTTPARFLLALFVWRLVPRREAAGTEEVVFGQVGGSILLLCRNVSKEATEVVWFQGDPHAFPPLFSSRVTFPPDVRFSLVDNSSLRITELRLQDEGNYTCKEVLNKTDHEHRVQLLVGKTPSLETEPPKTCFVGDNVTLTCRVTESAPEARLTWLRGIAQPEVEIQPGGRYLITQEGNVSQLTIQNCSQGTDGGCYVCKAQNPLGLRELFVCLTVKQPVNIVGVVGAVVVLSLLAVLTITGLVLYYNPLLCLRGAAFRSQDSGDVLVLVDSEDDDEGKEEEETLSSTKQEVMALVNGSSIQAAYQNCLTGDDGEQHGGVSLQETRGEEMQGS